MCPATIATEWEKNSRCSNKGEEFPFKPEDCKLFRTHVATLKACLIIFYIFIPLQTIICLLKWRTSILPPGFQKHTRQGERRGKVEEGDLLLTSRAKA